MTSSSIFWFLRSLCSSRVKVADERAFDDRLRAFIDTGGCNEDKALQFFCLQTADRGAGQLAQFSRSKLLRLAATDEEQALRLQPLRLVEEREFQHLAGDFSGSNQVGRSVSHGLVVRLDLRLRLGFVAIVVALGRVEHGDNEAFGFDL